MPSLVLKPTHKPVKHYYAALQQLAAQGATHEGAVKTAFQGLLESCASQRQWTLLGEYEIRRAGQHPLRVDAALRDNFWITHGYWEAKDTDDDLEQEARKKFAAGYPQDNILFQSPDRALLFQDRQLVLDADLTHPDRLVAAFNDFADLCRASLNPDLRDEAVEEMLIQHLLTERLFRKVFDNPEFVKRNAIAQQIEKVIDALSGQSLSRDEFLGKLTSFYRAVEDAAATITDLLNVAKAFSRRRREVTSAFQNKLQVLAAKAVSSTPTN